MKQHLLAAALALAASSAWGQAPPPGPYQFVSGPGVGTPQFTVTGFSTNLGGSVTGPDACAGLHIHGVFNGFGDPGGACGHGIISQVLSSIPGASSMLPGSIPNSAGGVFTLTRSETDRARDAASQDYLISLAKQGWQAEEDARRVPYQDDGEFADSFMQYFFGALPFDPSWSRGGETSKGPLRDGPPKPSPAPAANPPAQDGKAQPAPATTTGRPAVGHSLRAARLEVAEFDRKTTMFGTPQPTPEQVAKGPLRDGPAKPPPAPAANPPADEGKDGQASESILKGMEEPNPTDVLKAMYDPLPETEKARADHDKADEEVKKIFSGTPEESERARKLLPFREPEVRRLVERKVNERLRRIVLDATSAAAGAPRGAN